MRRAATPAPPPRGGGPGRLPAAACLAALLAAACGGAPAERGGAPPPSVRPPEILLHGRHGITDLPAGDARAGRLLAEVDSLFRSARPLAEAPGPADVAQARRRGALELRFAAARDFVTGDGDTLRLWRVLVPLGVEMLPDPSEAGALLLPGYPDYDAPPLLSRRPRRHLTGILESPPGGGGT
ncbi:MAG: hypothetical protein JW819_07450 [Candidatus Krumholzibacteriota bacterium]|nr:hypothetical protein [Candidatus Krumholzibacteriota bacterium]